MAVAQGIPTLADGFMGGLTQGMGIMRQARQDAMAQRQMAFQQQMALRQDQRAGVAADDQHNINTFTISTQPLKLQELQSSVAKAGYEAKSAATKADSDAILLKALPDKIQREATKDNADISHIKAETARTTQGITLDRRRDARETTKQNFDMRLDANKDTREQQDHDMKMGAEALPYYTQMRLNGINPPDALTNIVKKSPFGLTAMWDNAEAATHFPSVVQKMAKGDMSWHNNPDERTAMATLARPRGMAIAKQAGLDTGSARVLDYAPGKGGTVVLTVAGYDPKTHQYRTVQQPVNSQQMLGEMQTNARAGTMLAQHPEYQKIATQIGHGALNPASGGPVVQAAAKDYDTQLQNANRTLYLAAQAGSGVPPETVQRAKDWQQKYGANRDAYITDYTGMVKAAQSARGPDTNDHDFNRVLVTAARYTGSMDPQANLRNVNGSLGAAHRMDEKTGQDKELDAFVKKTTAGRQWDDPAVKVDVMNRVYNDPAMKQRLLGLLKPKLAH